MPMNRTTTGMDCGRRTIPSPTTFGSGGIESQRDSGSKPKVARHELPWETRMEWGSTPTGLRRRGVCDTTPLGSSPTRTPLGLDEIWHKVVGNRKGFSPLQCPTGEQLQQVRARGIGNHEAASTPRPAAADNFGMHSRHFRASRSCWRTASRPGSQRVRAEPVVVQISISFLRSTRCDLGTGRGPGTEPHRQLREAPQAFPDAALSLRQGPVPCY